MLQLLRRDSQFSSNLSFVKQSILDDHVDSFYAAVYLHLCVCVYIQYTTLPEDLGLLPLHAYEL